MIPKNLSLDLIRRDGGTQVRVDIDQNVVAHYAEILEALPPILVYFDGTAYWLADGFHRVCAARFRQWVEIPAIIQKGSQADARWAALGANRHGLPLSAADRANAIKMALVLDAKRSDRDIAAHIGVSPSTVAKHRADLQASATIPPAPNRTGQDGRTTATVQIGQSTPSGAIENAVPQSATPQVTIPESVSTPPASPPPATDETGRPIPTNCDQRKDIIEAFSRRGVLTTICTAIGHVKADVLELVEARDPLVASLTVSAFTAEIQGVYHRIKCLAPWAVCPFCAGDGCKACHKRGWVDKNTWDLAPKEMRGGV